MTTQEVLQDRYEVVRSIKSGGMGSVYEAIDRKLANTPCAIKEVLASAMQGPDAEYVLQSFETEMRSLATLEHPNIPRVRDYFEIEQRRYIVMDLVHGKALNEELQEHLRVTGAPMDPAVVAVDMVTVLDTLTYLHTRRPPIIHRDIKSANLIRDQRTGQIKVVDFGIARTLETKRTQTQVGTPGFCAPEQMAGRADACSDVFSTGATLYHLCTGTLPPPFSFDPLDADLPQHPGLVEIIKRATQLKPQDRYGSADEMAQALRAWIRNDKPSTPSPPVSLPVAELRSTPAHSGDRAVYITLVLLLLGVGGLFRMMHQNMQEASRPSPPPIHVAYTPALTKTPTPTKKVTQRLKQTKPNPQLAQHQPPAPRPPAPRIQPQVRELPSIPTQPGYQTSSSSGGYSPTSTVVNPSVAVANPPSQNDLPPQPGSASPGWASGDGKAYQKQVGSSLVKITIHPCQGTSADQVKDECLQYLNGLPAPHREPYGWATEGPRQGFYQAFHFRPGVAFDVQIRGSSRNVEEQIRSEVAQFMQGYFKR